MRNWVKAVSAGAILATAMACDDAPQRSASRSSATSTNQLFASPAALEFRDVGGTETRTVTFTNGGVAPVTISSITPCETGSTEFTFTFAAPVTLAPGYSLAQDVTYTPADFSSWDTGCLVVASDDAAVPTLTVPIAGLGMTMGWVFECTRCHGDRSRINSSPQEAYWASAPPVPAFEAVGGPSSETTDMRTGAHMAHLRPGPYSRGVPCQECHPYPPVGAHPKWDNGVPVYTMTWGPIATAGGTLVPTHDRVSGACANYCHGATLGGAANPAPIWNRVDGTQAACGACHGAPPPAPGHPQYLDCGACHVGYTTLTVNLELHVNGTLETTGCASCHGDPSRTDPLLAGAPPYDTRGDVSSTAPGVGAHVQHLFGTPLRAEPIACSECHVVPEDAAHATDASPPRQNVVFGPLARFASAPSYDPAAYTCASTYCHGATLTGGTARTPLWTRVDGTQDRCDSCHGAPPPTTAHARATACGNCHPGYTTTTVDPATHINMVTDVDLTNATCDTCHGVPPPAPHTASTACANCHPGYTSTTANPDTHRNGSVEYDLANATCADCHGVPPPAPHPTSTDCGTCHTGYTSTTANPDTHRNGTVDVLAGCTSCHGTKSRTPAAIAPAPPADTAGNTLTSARGVGAHQAHLAGGTLRVAMTCTECHLVPTDPGHKNGTIELPFGLLARARGVNASFNGTTCATYCHGTSLGSGTNHAPAWTTVNGTQDACGTCHGNTTGRPSTGAHTSVSSHSSRACTDCHAGTASATSATHVNGVVDLLSSMGWNATARSCSPSCHGSKSWGGTAYSIPATINASPSVVTFGDVLVGGTATQNVTVQNLGTSTLTVNGLALCAGSAPTFSLSSTAGFTLAAGASRSVTVTFAPATSASFTGCFTVASSDAAHNPTTVTLSGRGVPVTPAIAVTPSPLAFGTVYQGASVVRALAVSNAGNGPLNVTSIGLCAGTTAGFSVAPATLTVAAGGTATVNVTFTPAALGDVAAGSCVSLASNASAQPLKVPLTGSVVVAPPTAPAIAATPSPLGFGTVNTGSTTTKPLTVSNTGNATLTVSAIGLCAGTTAGFSVSPATLSVPAGGTAAVNVTFAPTVAGEVAAGSCVSFTSNDVARNPYTVPLTGTVIVQTGPIISATPNPLGFGYVSQWSSSKSLTLTVKNTGSSSLSVTRVARCSGTSSEFSFSTSTFSLAKGASRSLTVTYDPDDSGDDTGCIELTSNDTAHNPYRVTVTGTSVKPPMLGLSATSLSFGGVVLTKTATGTLELHNDGDRDLVVSGIAPCSSTSAEFSFPTAGFTLGHGASETLAVAYAPADLGADSGCLAIASNDPAAPVKNVALSGTGVKPVISVTPASLDYGYVARGDRKTIGMVVANTGTATLSVSSLRLCAGTSLDFEVSTSSFSVSPGASTTVSVAYDPDDSGADTGCIWVQSNDPVNGSLTVPVSGTTMTPPAIGVAPASLAFGDVSVGASATASVTVTNGGDQTLVVSGVSACSGTTAEYAFPATGFSLAKGAARTISVTYTPSAPGTDAGCLSVASNDPAAPVKTVSLTGTGHVPSAEILVTPASLSFGAVKVGSAATLTAQVTNVGDLDLFVDSIALRAGTSPEFFVAPVSVVLLPGQSQTVVVNYVPSGAGVDTGFLDLVSNDPLNPVVSVSLAATGVQPPVISASPSPLAFGNVARYNTKTLTLSVSNGGGGTLNVSGVARCAGTSSEFSVPGTGFSVAPGATKALSVSYRPTGRGTDTGCIAITSDDAVRNPLQVPVSGTGT